MNINEGFRKDVTYNIKSHKKIGLLPLPRKCIFEKTTVGGQVLPHSPPAFLGLKRTESFNTFKHKSTTC